MIQNTVIDSNTRLQFKTSDRLRSYFVSLARQLCAWRAQAANRVSLGVSSVDAQVGKSTVAFNLAAALSSVGQGKVLLIETDFGRSHIGRRIARPAHGLSEILSGEMAPQNCIHPTNIENLFVVGCGEMNAREALELPYDTLINLNHDLSDEYKFIVYDLPVASSTTNCLPIAQYLDGCVIVCDAEDFAKEKVDRIRRRMNQFGTQIVGIVLNKAKQE